MTKQVQITAGDHGEAAPDQPDDGIAQWRGLPWIGGNACLAVDRYGDFAIGRAPHVSVDRLKHQAQTPALLARQPRVGQGPAAVQDAPEARQSVDPIEQIEVDRNEGDEGTAVAAGKEEQLDGLFRRAECVDALRGVPDRFEIREGRGRHPGQMVGDRRNRQHGRNGYGRPEDRLGEGGQARPRGEIAVPTAADPPREAARFPSERW